MKSHYPKKEVKIEEALLALNELEKDVKPSILNSIQASLLKGNSHKVKNTDNDHMHDFEYTAAMVYITDVLTGKTKDCDGARPSFIPLQEQLSLFEDRVKIGLDEAE